MFGQLLQGAWLVAVTVAIHGAALSWLERRLSRSRLPARPVGQWLLLAVVAFGCVLAHFVEILAWGGFYAWRGVMPDVETAAYFSAVTYATIGYGDVTPPQAWRLIAGMEGLTGIMMCGWSGAFFVATASRLAAAHAPRSITG